ncbi:MAG: PEP-CTERM sorting domain-containing protein [Burkholderiales bacterium]|nr:PEP-CTERM sorting domain-containing protein [Burkholderiales bacterium]
MEFRSEPWLRGLVLGGGVLAASQAMAYTPFAIDELRVQWSNANVSISFVDAFDNGNPLIGGTYTNLGTGDTSTPATTNYFAATRTGAAPADGSESGGKLRFAWDDMADSTFGSVVTGRSLNYILFTSTQYTAGGNLENRGLWKGNNFGVQSIWDLKEPLESDHIRLRLTDGFTGHPANDLLDLSLWRIGDGYLLRSRRLNIVPGGVDELVETGDISGFAGDADQIMLRYSHLAGDGFVSTSFAFLKDGVSIYEAPVGMLTLFNGEDWTRASFGSYALNAPIPEPQTYALMLLGLASVAAAARRRHR